MAVNLMTTAQVAERLSRDVRTVHRMVEDGRIEATKLPGETGAYLFEPAEVERVAAELAAELRARLASAVGA
jgi:excisionase family DNA binding protein